MVEPMITPSAAPDANPADPLGRLLCWLAVAALALAPTQLTFGPFHPSEPFLLLAALVWAIRWLKVRDTASLPPFAHWLVIAASALSVFALFAPRVEGAEIDKKATLVVHALHATLAKAAVKEWTMDTVKVILYLLVAVTIYRAVFTSAARIRAAVITLLITTTLTVGLAVTQRVLLQHQYQPDPAKRAVFASSVARIHDEGEEGDNAAGGKSADNGPIIMGVWRNGQFTPCGRKKAYLTVETPMAVCATFGSWNEKGFHPSRIAYAGFLAVVLPFALVLFATDRRKWVRLWLGLLFTGAACSVLAGIVTPAIALGLLCAGICLGPHVSRWVLAGVLVYAGLLLVIPGFNHTEVLREPYRLAMNEADAARIFNGTRHLKKSWAEQYAALNAFRGSPVIGAGNGQYQASIDASYDILSTIAIPTNRLESDAQNGYLVALVNTGLVGLAAWLALLGLYLGLARANLKAEPRDPWAAAAMGALVALVLLMFVTNPWVRGTMVPLAAIMAIIGNRATREPAARIEE